MTAWAEPLPLIDRRLQWAVATSLLVHVVFVMYLHAPRYELADSADRPALLVSLRPAAPVPVVNPDPIVVAEPVEPVQVPMPLLRSAEAMVDPNPAPAAPAERQTRRKAATLNLAVPEAYLADEEMAVAGSEDLEAVFDPTLRAEIERARATAQRRRTIDNRAAARSGVAAADYARDSGDGLAIKTESGCFVQRQGQSLGSEALWWRTPCSESSVSAWEQAQIDEANLHPTLRRR